MVYASQENKTVTIGDVEVHLALSEGLLTISSGDPLDGHTAVTVLGAALREKIQQHVQPLRNGSIEINLNGAYPNEKPFANFDMVTAIAEDVAKQYPTLGSLNEGAKQVVQEQEFIIGTVPVSLRSGNGSITISSNDSNRINRVYALAVINNALQPEINQHIIQTGQGSPLTINTQAPVRKHYASTTSVDANHEHIAQTLEAMESQYRTPQHLKDAAHKLGIA